MNQGPLSGLRVVELAGIGPAPMCAMLLADLGAEIIRIDRPDPGERGIERPIRYNLLLRNRPVLELDLKKPEDLEAALKLVDRADALIEGFRPGVTERLGIGPDDCLARNPRLVYGRITGWGQDGPLSQAAGHDLNYVALTGALHHTGRVDQPPSWPLNILGDYAGGSLYLAIGLLAAVLETKRSGIGQVVDSAIVDGTAHLMTSAHGLHAAGILSSQRGANILDSGAPFYECYQCSDGLWVSIAPLEARFHTELIKRMGFDPTSFPRQSDHGAWPAARRLLSTTFLSKTRSEWCALLEGTDACFAPVLTIDEANHHPHMISRRVYVDVDGVVQPRPAPRFSRTMTSDPSPPGATINLHQALKAWA